MKWRPSEFMIGRMNKLFKNYGLSITLGGLFLVSWIIQFIFQIPAVANEAMHHGQQFQWSEFWSQFIKDSMENWQSEFLQLFTFVTLTTYLIHKDSPESRDSGDKMQATLDRIENKLDKLK